MSSHTWSIAWRRVIPARRVAWSRMPSMIQATVVARWVAS
jgi:hypothetical protein